jgi:glycosyltransferase involved in cell wall biosynthesis
MRREFCERYRVSVVIPYYNSLDLLWEALESICRQTIVPDEIIVIDDASAVQLELPSQCESKIALRLIRAAVNRGAAWCRNKGIEEANGDLIAFLDADDRWLPNKLERCIAAIGPMPAKDEAQVLFSNVVLKAGSRRALGNSSPYEGRSMLDFILIEEGYIQTSSIMMWRHQYPLIRFDDSLRRHQDWDFAINAELSGCEFLYLHEALVEYSLNDYTDRISGKTHCEPSLEFFKKYDRLMSRGHISSFVFNVLIYKKLSIATRLNILMSVISGSIEMPGNRRMSPVLRLIIGRGGVDLVKRFDRRKWTHGA